MHYQKNPILIEDVDIDKLLMSINVSSGGKKYESFNGYKSDDYEIKLLSLILSETSTYGKSYDDETIWMLFMIEDGELLKIIIKPRIKLVIVLKKIW